MDKKIILSAIGIGLGTLISAHSLAGGPGSFDTPDARHITVYGDAMWVFPSEDATYVGTDTTKTPDVTLHNKKKGSFGGTIGAAYTFDNGSDIRAEWQYLPGKFDALTYKGNEYDYKQTYNAVNIDLGQNWHPVTKLNLHFFTGLAYRNYKVDVPGFYTDSGQYDGSTGKSTYSGWGPRFGIDGQYQYYQWLALKAHVALSFPYGKYDSSGIENAGSTVNIDNEKIDKLIPEIASRVGLEFSQDFSSALVGLEVGYRVVHLMNSDLDLTWLASKTNNHGYEFSDTTFFGPYIRLSASF